MEIWITNLTFWKKGTFNILWPFQKIRNYLPIPSCQRSFWITPFFSDALALIRTSKSEYGSATELCNFLDRLMASLTRSRNSLVNPKKKTLDELRNSRQVVWFLFFFTKRIIEHCRKVVQSLSILQQNFLKNLPKYLHTIVIIGYFCKYQSVVLVKVAESATLCQESEATLVLVRAGFWFD